LNHDSKKNLRGTQGDARKKGDIFSPKNGRKVGT